MLTHRPFQNLRRRSKQRRASYGSPTAVKATDTSLSDEDLFSQEMEKVKEIREFRELRVRSKYRTRPRKRPPRDTGGAHALTEIVHGKRSITLQNTQEYVEWVSKGYHPDIVQKLHEGFYSVQDSLDLHGYSIEAAEDEVKSFLQNSLKKGLCCVKIIHGRGLRSQNGPVLKKSLVRLLSVKYRKYIIAFVTARQCDGGLGALYILLRF